MFQLTRVQDRAGLGAKVWGKSRFFTPQPGLELGAIPRHPSTGSLVSDTGGRKTLSDTSRFAASAKSTRGGAGASALQRQTCSASYTAPMHRAGPEATLSLLFKFPGFMHFFQTLMKDLLLRSKSLPEAPQDGVKVSF